MEHVEVLERLRERCAALDAAIASLSALKYKAGDNMEAGAGHVQGSEWVLVRRSDLIEWAQDWLNDYDPNDGTDCVTPFDTYLLKSPAEAQPCGCGEATCTVPWEPGCGLGKSEQHAEAQEQGGGEVEAALDVDAEQFRRGWQAGFAEGRRDQQPTSDGGFTAADMMDARQEGRKEAREK